MDKYVSHRVVEAGRIIAVAVSTKFMNGLALHTEVSGAQYGEGQNNDVQCVTQVPSDWVKKHLPDGALHPSSFIGGYLVFYPDGYLSWSPAKSFEEGYTLVDPKDPEDATA